MGVSRAARRGALRQPRDRARGRCRDPGPALRARHRVAAGHAVNPGLDGVALLTNETIFALDATPSHLIIIGGGPFGAEMAPAHRRLGSRVTLVEAVSLLSSHDPDCSRVVAEVLGRDGVAVIAPARVLRPAKARPALP